MKPYTPKAIRGQQFASHIKINKRQVEKLFTSGQSFTGFIVGNNMNTFHFFGGWHLACKLECSTLEEFNGSLNSFLFYLDRELGNNAAIYLKK